MDINKIRARNEVPKYIKELKKYETSNVVKTHKTKLYEYYKCDYCNSEILLNQKITERSGGLVTFPNILTKKGNITFALCNKCLVPVLKIIEEENK